MIIGIQLSSVKKYMQTARDVRASLSKLASAGYRYAQIQWTGASVTASEMASALKETGMTAVSVQDYTHAVLGDTDYYLRLADACEFRDITISGIPAEEMTSDGICRFAERIAPLHHRLIAEGRTLSFHPRWQELSEVDGVCALTRLLDASDPALRVLPDVNHIIRNKLDAPTFIRSLAGRADMIHCKDSVDDTKEKSHLTVVGQGCVDWASVLSAADEIGIRYAFTEQENWDGDAFECLTAGGWYLQSLSEKHHF